jgi:hypothetical protein
MFPPSEFCMHSCVPILTTNPSHRVLIHVTIMIILGNEASHCVKLKMLNYVILSRLRYHHVYE